MSKYIEMFNERKPRTREDVIGAIATMNAYTLCLSEEKIESEKQDFIEFYLFFVKNYADDAELMAKMEENWFGELPRVLRIAESLMEKEEKEYVDGIYNQLNYVAKMNVDVLTDYIWEIREDRIVTIVTAEETRKVHLPKYIPKDVLQFNKEWLRGHIALAAHSEDAGIVVRQLKKHGKDILMGFEVIDFKLSVTAKDVLKRMCEQQPDGSFTNFDDEQVYEEGTCEFRYFSKLG